MQNFPMKVPTFKVVFLNLVLVLPLIAQERQSEDTTSLPSQEPPMSTPSSEPSSTLLPGSGNTQVQALFANMNRPAPVTPPMVEQLQKVLVEAEKDGYPVRYPALASKPVPVQDEPALLASINRPAPVTPPMVEQLQKALVEAEENRYPALPPAPEPVPIQDKPVEEVIETMTSVGTEPEATPYSSGSLSDGNLSDGNLSEKIEPLEIGSHSSGNPSSVSAPEPRPSVSAHSAPAPPKKEFKLFKKRPGHQPLFGPNGKLREVISGGKKSRPEIVPDK